MKRVWSTEHERVRCQGTEKFFLCSFVTRLCIIRAYCIVDAPNLMTAIPRQHIIA